MFCLEESVQDSAYVMALLPYLVVGTSKDHVGLRTMQVVDDLNALRTALIPQRQLFNSSTIEIHVELV